jgi:hypothetical protein
MKRLNSSYAWVVLVGLSAIAAANASACATEKQNQFQTGSTSGGNNGGTSGSTTTTSSGMGGDGGGIIFPAGSGGSGGGSTCNEGLPDKDNDGDGYSENQGDCNDCDKNVNPGAVEVITPDNPDAGPDAGSGDPVDENCNGKVDEAPTPCDTGLTLNSEEPLDATKAIGMCAFVKTAKWVLADGSPPPVDATKLKNFHLGHGILPKFGTNNKPQEGVNMLMLSSGTARDKSSAESVYRTFDKNYTSNAPYGFPKPSAACPGVTTGLPHDATGVQIEVNAPTNALSASFDFQFFTYEWHDFICQQFNDFFVAHVEPFPAGQMDGNVAFDGMKNPISVNNAFINACACPGNPPGTCNAGGVSFTCALGKTYLAGTPFENDLANPNWSHGSTGWLRTTMPVTPGSTFRIRFVTYDSSDGNLDSSTLVDNWQWYGVPGENKTIDIPPN